MGGRREWPCATIATCDPARPFVCAPGPLVPSCTNYAAASRNVVCGAGKVTRCRTCNNLPLVTLLTFRAMREHHRQPTPSIAGICPESSGRFAIRPTDGCLRRQEVGAVTKTYIGDNMPPVPLDASQNERLYCNNRKYTSAIGTSVSGALLHRAGQPGMFAFSLAKRRLGCL